MATINRRRAPSGDKDTGGPQVTLELRQLSASLASQSLLKDLVLGSKYLPP